jgi:hypothetical protein
VNVFALSPMSRFSSKFLGNAFLVGGAVAVLLAMAGWLYFLGWLGWHLFNWILT